jgi:hypothetical protein
MAQGFQGFPVRTPLASSQIVLLSTVAAVAATSADIEWTQSADYMEYMIVCSECAVGTASDNIQARMKYSGSYQTAAGYKYQVERTGTATAANTFNSISGSGTTSIVLADAMSATADDLLFFTAFINRNLSASITSHMNWFGCQGGSATASSKKSNGTAFFSNGILQGVRFFASTGTISGTFKLYGLKS